MTGPSNALSIIPVTAKVVAACIWMGSVGLFLAIASRDASIPPLGVAGIVLLAPVALALYTLLVGYVYADAKRRGMRYVMWTWLSVLIPNSIGIILYFLLREPLLAPCLSCGAALKGAFAFCPKCGSPARSSCPHCKRAVESGWAACAWCGQKLA